MKNIHFIYVATLLCASFLTSCNKDQQDASIADLPVSVGTKWKYIVYDSIHNYTDTQTVTITGATTMADGRSARIVSSCPVFSADSPNAYLVEDADKATFYTNQEGKDYNKIYVYPLKTGASWQGENILDTNRVVSNENVDVPAGSFSAYVIKRNYTVTNMAVVEKEWYFPGVGMVQRNYYERNLGFIINKTFRLISYSIIK